MGQIAQALGLGAAFHFENEDYRVSPWTYKLQGDFELYLQGEAVKNAKRVGAALSEEDRKELLAQVSRDITAGVYSFGGEVVAKALSAVPHLKFLFLLMLKTGNPDKVISRELVDRMFEAEFDEALRAMSEANADPTKAPPAGEPTTTT